MPEQIFCGAKCILAWNELFAEKIFRKCVKVKGRICTGGKTKIEEVKFSKEKKTILDTKLI